jgi:hypothetical protein
MQKEAFSPSFDLEEMQCLAFLVEEGDAQYRHGDLAMALKRYKSIENVIGAVDIYIYIYISKHSPIMSIRFF